jgi:hypothetical protein
MTNGSENMVMPVAPMYGSNNGFGNSWGGDGWWILLLLLFAGGWGNGFGGGYGGNAMMSYDFPWLLNGQSGINANTNNGFQNAMLNDNVTSIRDGISALSTQICGLGGDISQQLCSGFAGVTSSVTGAQNAIAQQLYTNQLADLERSFNAQTASAQGMSAIQAQLAQCCCDNRLATANLGSDIAREACATRTADTQNTQALLNAVNSGVQSIKDQICQDKIDAKNEKIADLERQLTMANLSASQTAQNAFIQRGFSDEVDQLYNRLNSCPVPTTPVYGRTPIFTCNQNTGCGCACGM